MLVAYLIVSNAGCGRQGFEMFPDINPDAGSSENAEETNEAIPDLAARYPMDDDLSDLMSLDISGNNHHAACPVSDICPSQADGHDSSSGYLFDGTNDRLLVSGLPISSGLDAFTVSLWVSLSSVSVDHVITGQQIVFGEKSWLLSHNTSVGLLLQYGSVGDVAAAVQPNLVLDIDTWTHIAVSFDQTVVDSNDSVRLYVNGSLVGSDPRLPVLDDSDLSIGARVEGWSPLLGKIDEFHLYLRALSPAEIQSLATDQ